MYSLRGLAPLLFFFCANCCFGQHWGFGAVGGYSFAPEVTASNSQGEIKTGLKSGATVGAVVSQDLYNYLSGEIRYLYRFGDWKASGLGRDFSFPGHSHAIHYDVVVHTAPRGAAVRPFIAVGAGVRLFRGTGQERATQPLDDFVVLTQTEETKPLFTPGAGIKFRMSDHFSFAVEVRDYITPVPDKIIAPVPGARLSGWLHDLTPLISLTLRP